MTTQLESSFVEHRSSVRHRVLKRGVIVINSGRSTINCTLRNISKGGAKLQFDSLLGVPDTFDIITAEILRQTCKVAWRGGAEVGVAFVNAA